LEDGGVDPDGGIGEEVILFAALLNLADVHGEGGGGKEIVHSFKGIEGDVERPRKGVDGAHRDDPIGQLSAVGQVQGVVERAIAAANPKAGCAGVERALDVLFGFFDAGRQVDIDV